MLLTKAQILQGIKYTENLYVEELNSEVKIRVLSDGEFAKIEADYIIELGKLGISYDDLQGLQEAKAESITLDKSGGISLATRKRQWEICAKALSVDEQWTVEDVQQLPGLAIDKIVARTEEISQGRLEQIKNFREQLRGQEAEVVE